MSQLFEPTLAEMIAELERELALRRRVYPRQVANRLMPQERADRRIAVLEAAIRRLQQGDGRA